jgi:hypothetical protein
MGLDIRKPIGLLLLLLGLQLVVFGLTSDASLYQKSLGFNINSTWGAVMVVTGLLLLGLSYRSARK